MRHLLLLALAAPVFAILPRYPRWHSHGCNDTVSKQLPFCNAALPVSARVSDLVSRMTLAQKIAARYDLEPDLSSTLGFQPFNWNQEGLHGLGAQCFEANSSSGSRCPTIFAAPPGLAASFNLSLLNSIGDAIGTEARAYNNFGGNRGYQNRPVDLQVWLPNVNVGRDARWGREVETYSEDAWLNGLFGAAIVSGTQQGADGGASGGGYLKNIVAVKCVARARFDQRALSQPRAEC